MRSPSDKSDPEFKASDVKEIAGISYRQLNDWDSKGTLPESRENSEGWRKFSSREMLFLLVSAELRKKFGASVEALTWLKSCMIREGADHFRYAVEMMSFGFTIYLLTDFSETFIMDTDLEFSDLLFLGGLQGDEPRSYAFIKINPLVNKILGCLEKPVHLKTKPEFYDLVRQIRLDPNAHNTQEYEALRLIREKAYQQVSLTIRDGEIVTMSAEEDIPIKEQKEREKLILDALRSHRFQTLTVKVSDGNVVHLSQARTLKQKKGKKP